MLKKAARMYIQHMLKDNENNKPKVKELGKKDEDKENEYVYMSRKELKEARRLFAPKRYRGIYEKKKVG